MGTLEDNTGSSENNPYDVEAVNRRKEAVAEALNNPDLTGYEESDALKKLWLEEMGDAAIQEAIGRNEKRWGNPETLVVSFTDAALHYKPDSDFAGLFFKSLGAHINLEDGALELDPDPAVISDILSKDTNLPRVVSEFGLNDIMDNLPQGSFVTTTKEGNDDYLVCETDIEGVRLVLEGPGISNPKGTNRSVRPMLLIKMSEKKFEPLGEEIPPDPRKTWTEIHGRPTTPGENTLDYGKKIEGQAILENDMDMALAGSAWIPVAKEGSEILVTPTILKEKPALNAEERLETVREAFDRASEHFDSANSGQTEPLVGNTMWSFNIMRDVLGMTPEEIMKDGEALGTLVEYLEEVARARPNIYGHSVLLPPAEEGNELAELTALIKDTWDFPDQSGISSDLLGSRVDWKKRPRPPLQSN